MSGSGVVIFNYLGWSARYPELNVPDATAQRYFDEAAAVYLNNTACSPVQSIPARTVLLNMLVAHIAAMNGAGASPLVGRIANAAEGSVNVATEYSSTVSGSMAWFIQTKYGAGYWQATAQYRTFRYAPGVQPLFGVGYGARPGFYSR